MYDYCYSSGTLSNITKVITGGLDNFHNRLLPSQLAVVYPDATFITIINVEHKKKALKMISPPGLAQLKLVNTTNATQIAKATLYNFLET